MNSLFLSVATHSVFLISVRVTTTHWLEPDTWESFSVVFFFSFPSSNSWPLNLANCISEPSHNSVPFLALLLYVRPSFWSVFLSKPHFLSGHPVSSLGRLPPNLILEPEILMKHEPTQTLQWFPITHFNSTASQSGSFMNEPPPTHTPAITARFVVPPRPFHPPYILFFLPGKPSPVLSAALASAQVSTWLSSSIDTFG